MARIRSIKPEFWVSEQIAECSTNARLTFIGLWNFCDDNGVHPAKPKTLKAEIYPMDDFSAGDVAGWIAELVSADLLAEFQSGGNAYWHVTGWSKHQKIDRPSYKHPAPPASISGSVPRTLDEPSSNTRRAPPPGEDRSGEDRSGVEKSSSTISPPTPSVTTLLTLPNCPHRDLIAEFVAKVPELPRPRAELWSGGKDADAMRARWKWVLTATRDGGKRYATTEAEAIEWFGKLFDRVAASDFLTGRDGKWTACDLGWLMKQSNFSKVVQGNYKNREAA